MNYTNTYGEIKNYLTELGFKLIKTPLMRTNRCCWVYKKEYKNENEILYNIEAIVTYYNDLPKIEPLYCVEYSSQLFAKDHKSFDLSFCDWEFEKVEQLVENLYKNENLESYSKWQKSFDF